MRQMMDNIIDKYKTNINQQKSEITKPSIDITHLSSQPYNKVNPYEDKIEVYRMIRST